ncbi:hypothetical protein [Anoxybacteroides tepidamans]|uniref:hypothetical protein n=1 Tax=Anoxybacteroides tepidamans TaxID=265948 RepID=UPI000489766E|nr:hypothetical protein [Anoxybacillus tepidamans]
MEWLLEALFETLDIWIWLAFDLNAPKRRFKRLRNEHWFAGYYPQNNETLKNILRNPDIRTHLIDRRDFKKLLSDQETQERFKSAIAKYL